MTSDSDVCEVDLDMQMSILKGNQSEDTSCPEHVEHVETVSLAGFAQLFFQYILLFQYIRNRTTRFHLEASYSLSVITRRKSEDFFCLALM